MRVRALCCWEVHMFRALVTNFQACLGQQLVVVGWSTMGQQDSTACSCCPHMEKTLSIPWLKVFTTAHHPITLFTCTHSVNAVKGNLYLLYAFQFSAHKYCEMRCDALPCYFVGCGKHQPWFDGQHLAMALTLIGIAWGNERSMAADNLPKLPSGKPIPIHEQGGPQMVCSLLTPLACTGWQR